MIVQNMKAVIQSDIRTVWKFVTSVEHYSWRSDLSNTVVLNKRQFVEYTAKGYATTFTTTVMEPYKHWEFDMENSNMNGHWIGVFTERGSETEIDFTEYVTVKKFYMKPFVKSFLKKQQAQFISDLKKAVC